MIRTLGTILVCLCLRTVVPSTAEAQPSVLFGITAHYEFDIPSSSYHDPGFAADCGCDGIGEASGRSASSAATLGLAAPFGSGFDLLGRIAIRSSTQAFVSPPYDIPLTGEPASVPATYLYERDSRALSLRFELLGSYTINDWITLSAGPWLTSRVRTYATQRESIASPGTATFPSGGRERLIVEGEPVTVGGTDAGAAIGLSFRVPLNESTVLLPELFVHAALNPNAESGGDGRFVIGGGTSLILNISDIWSGSPDNDVPAPPQPKLAASIDIYAPDESGQRLQEAHIIPRTTHYRQEMPLPVRFFFEEGSSDLPERYTFTDQESFTVDSLSRCRPLEVYYRGLDVIGLRMSQTPNATLTVTGFSTPEESADIRSERAATVTSYLVDEWEIAPERIRTTTSQGTANQACAVEITSESEAITAPIVTERLHRGFDLPPIGLTPVIDADAGTQEWEITVRWNEKIVGFYSSDPNAERSLDIAIDVPDAWHPGDALPPLVAELRVEDSTGTVATALDTLPLSIPTEGSSPASPDEELTFLEPIDPPPVGSGAVESGIVRAVVATAQPDARVTLSPLLPHESGNGNLTHRTEEIERLANAIRTAIPSADVAVGSSVDSLDSDPDISTEESRGLPPETEMMAGIRITVEQPRSH